jgi:hypothetical protein
MKITKKKELIKWLKEKKEFIPTPYQEKIIKYYFAGGRVKLYSGYGSRASGLNTVIKLIKEYESKVKEYEKNEKKRT